MSEASRRLTAKLKKGKTPKPSVRYVLGEVVAVDATGCEVDLGGGVTVDAVVSATVGTVQVGQGVRLAVQGNTYTVESVTDITSVSGTVAARTYVEQDNDGRLFCRGSYGFPANPGASQSFTWTFPVTFVGEVPAITVIPDTTAPENCSVGQSSVSLTGVNIRFSRSTNAATTVYFTAQGRWK